MSQPKQATGTGEKRSQSLVNSRLQGRILVRVAVLWSAYHVLLWSGAFACRYWEVRIQQGDAGLGGTFFEVSRQIAADLFPLILVSLAVLPILCYEVIQTTHRIAGPLVRLDRGLRHLKEGRRVEPIRIRRADLVHCTIDAFNDYVVMLNNAAPDAIPAESDLEGAPEDIGDRLLAEVVALHADCRESVRSVETGNDEIDTISLPADRRA